MSLGYDQFRVVTATCGFFPLCGFFLFSAFVRSLSVPSLSYDTSRELPVLYIEHHTYHNHCLRAFLLDFAPLPTLPQSSLGRERAAIRVSLSLPSVGIRELDNVRL